MGEDTKKGGPPRDGRLAALGELIHAAVRRAIELAVDLPAARGAPRYERCVSRCRYRNGSKPRTLTGPTSRRVPPSQTAQLGIGAIVFYEKVRGHSPERPRTEALRSRQELSERRHRRLRVGWRV